MIGAPSPTAASLFAGLSKSGRTSPSTLTSAETSIAFAASHCPSRSSPPDLTTTTATMPTRTIATITTGNTQLLPDRLTAGPGLRFFGCVFGVFAAVF